MIIINLNKTNEAITLRFFFFFENVYNFINYLKGINMENQVQSQQNSNQESK